MILCTCAVYNVVMCQLETVFSDAMFVCSW